MTHAPNDTFFHTNYDDEFNNLDGYIQQSIYFQADNSILNDGSSSTPDELLALNNDPNDILNESLDPTQRLILEQSFPEAILGETTLLNLSNDENMVNEIQSETNSTFDDDQPTSAQVPEKINLKSVDSYIQQGLISVSVQPSNNPRRRYRCEGKRRDSLITLDLSKLKNYKLDPDEVLWLRISLITYSENPSEKSYIHPDVLKYFSGQIYKGDDGSICIRITQSDIEAGILKLKDLSIIKTNDNNYTFKLIPYDLTIMNNQSDPFVIDKNKTTGGNAKIFREKYNIIASRIACQILIKENQSWYFTDISCVTNVMIENKYQRKTTKSRKRLVKNSRKRKPIKSTKRKTRSNY